MKKKWQISRRRMLKGLGATIALPLLEAMIPTGLSAFPRNLSTSPKRLACMFMPNGVNPHKWNPEQIGSEFTLSPILQPLAGMEDKLLILEQLMNKNSISRLDGHYTKTANFLTSMPIQRTIGSDIHSGGVSLDQLVARKTEKETLFPSLEYGLDRISSGVDAAVGFTRLYGSTISWKTPTQPNPKEIYPRLAFDRLFRGFVPNKPSKAENPFKKSVLDAVLDDAKSLDKQLGISDQNKLAEYMASIRSVEKRIDSQEKLADFEAQITPDIRRELIRVDQRLDEYVEFTAGIDITEKVKLFMDLMVLAFWSDATRVTTFMFGNSVSGRNFSFLEGVNGGFHSISHHKDDPRRLDQYETINRWHIEQYGYFLRKLDAIKEGDGTLLDNSMVLFGSGLRNGNAHSPFNLPIVLAGKGGGTLKTGQNLVFEENTPLANLYLTMLQNMDVEANHFGDSTGVLCEIQA